MPLEIRSKWLLSEMLNYIYKPSKQNPNIIRMEAQGSEHDDRVMAAAMAGFTMPNVVFVPPPKEIAPFGSLEYFRRRRDASYRGNLAYKIGNF
jgi:hypothetical protein